MMRTSFWLALFVIVAQLSTAQSPTTGETQQPREFSRAIEDNSFYVEEAFNQEAGVVQHISSMSYFRSPSKDVTYSFTQEWPVGSQLHQLSFTVSYSFLDGNRQVGFNDVLLNYRYQLAAVDAWAAVAPRLSVILPTGNEDKGLGNGVVGLQSNIPVSKRISELIIVHVNAGATVFPNVRGTMPSGAAVRRTLTSFNLAGSMILLAVPAMNVLCEASSTFSSELNDGEISHTTQTLLSPGVRFAIDVGRLQIVPGLAVPFLHADGNWEAGVFLYLSFEHPF